MINKEDMLTLVRSVAVPDDVEQGMSHAYDLGVDWERARVEKIIGTWWDAEGNTNMEALLNDIRNGVQYT